MNKGQAAGLLREAYEKLKDTEAEAAYILLEQALDSDYENEEIKYALKCVHWWLEHTRRIDELKNPYEKGSFLIAQLKQYYIFLDHITGVDKAASGEYFFEQCQYAIRCFVYSRALFFFMSLLKNPVNQHDPVLLLMSGRCNKGLGNYDEALKFLEHAACIHKEDAEILAELADVSALLAQIKDAKTLFREAFFIDPLKIDLRSLESALILKLIDKVSELGYKGDELREWIPVYGYIWKVFSEKRELKQTEVGRLKNSIFTLEAEYDSNLERQEIIKPRLLNHYFRLLDYYEIVHEDASLIDVTLLKIKVKAPDIFEMFSG